MGKWQEEIQISSLEPLTVISSIAGVMVSPQPPATSHIATDSFQPGGMEE